MGGCGNVSPVEIVALHGGEGDAQRYRCLHLQQQLYLSGGVSTCVFGTGEVTPQAIDNSRLVVLHRVPLDKCVMSLISRVRHRGGLVVFDTDDLIFGRSGVEWPGTLVGGDRIRAALRDSEVGRYRSTIESVDAVLVSTCFLAQQALSLAKPVYVHRNAFSLEMLRVSDQAHQSRPPHEAEVVIGYASGTPTHDRDFQQAKPALMHILDRHPQTVLWIIGPLEVGDGWGRLHGKIRRTPFVAWQQLPSLLAQFDINIAPLEIDNPFCQAKSEVKYIEAGLVRVPTIASATGAFQYAIRSGDNGFLARSEQDWAEALERLVGDPRLRREMGERAYADVLQRYHPLVRGRELVDTLDQISREVKGRALWPDGLPCLDGDAAAERLWSLEAACQPSSPNRHRSLLDRALYALRYRGVRIFLMQAWVYLRSQLGPTLSTCPSGRQRRHDSR